MIFHDIKFESHPVTKGIMAKVPVNGYEISIVAGEGLYSSPNKNVNEFTQYGSYEVAVFKGDDIFKEPKNMIVQQIKELYFDILFLD